MAAHSVGGEHPAAHMLREALGAIASAEVMTELLATALEDAGLSSVPLGGSALRDFVSGSLLSAARTILGDDAAENLLAQLGPIVAHIPSQRPPARSDSMATERAPEPASGPIRIPSETYIPAPGTRAVVLATRDPALAETLRARLPGREVLVVEDIVTLIDAVQVPRAAPPVLVVDVATPSVQPSTLVTVSPDLAEGTTIVLWGADDDVRDRLTLFGSVAEHWHHFGPDAPVDVLFDLIEG